MKIFSVIIFITLSIMFLIYVGIIFYQKIKIIRKYKTDVKKLKGTDFTTKEKYTVVKLFDYVEQQKQKEIQEQEKKKQEVKK